MRLDRHFLKKNSCFCIHFIQQRQNYKTPSPLSIEQETQLDSLLKEPFTYLSRGNCCYAFVSQDGKYVLKFQRIPSHKRIGAFLFNASSYFLHKNEKKMQRWSSNIASYINCYTDLQKETGCLFLQAHPNPSLKKKAILIDKTKNRYLLDLSSTTFIIQERARLVLPTLQELIDKQEFDLAKRAITHILELLTATFSKGYIYTDPVIQTNFGLLADRAIFIDMGSIRKNSSSQNLADYLKTSTHSLHCSLIENHPTLLEHYVTQTIKILKNNAHFESVKAAENQNNP
jgi:hypothetical protein